MTQVSCNCIVCAKEFYSTEVQGITLSSINSTRFKICESCLDACDPADDYRQAREIVDSYLKFSQAKQLFNEASEILEELKNN